MAAVAGPVGILAAVLVVMHGFWLSPKLTNQQVDLLAFWFPRFCAIGKAVAAGHVPTWLPNQFGGVPFASDPQSGWLYLPVMALFPAMSCARAFGLFIVLQPVLAGLGLYWFFRNEGLGRPASTVGGLTVALAMCGSVVALALPFAGTLAWTAMSLAGASGLVHASRAGPRLGWFALTELALSQIAAAHLTDGLLIGLAVVALYLVARLPVQVRTGGLSARAAIGLGVGVFAAFPLLSAGVLVPRLALLPRTSIGHGYLELGRLANQLSGTNGRPPIYLSGVGPWWGTSFARGPGGYVGALAILLIPAALASRRWRWPAAGFAVLGFVGWVLNLNVLISSRRIRDFTLAHRVGELWLRSPYRFRYLLVIAFAALAGYGFQAWLDMARASDRRALLRRSLWLAGPVVVFGVAPLVAGARIADYVPLAFGLAYAVPLLLLAARGERWPLVVLPALLAVELTVVGLVAQLGPVPRNVPDRLEEVAGSGLEHSFPKFHAPFISPADYLTPGPIGRALIAAQGPGPGRYLSFDPKIASRDPRGFLFHQDPAHWPAYENGRSIVFGLDEVQGYSPVQEDRYWRLVRAADTKAPIYYNSATFQSLDAAVLRLFGAEWIIQRTRLAPPAGASPAAVEGAWTLYRLPDPDPRASVVWFWQVEPPDVSLRTVLFAKGFSPSSRVLLDRSPGLPLNHPPDLVQPAPTASYSERRPEDVVVRVFTAMPGVVVIRNAFDRNWHATVDGHPARVIPADYLMQGVPVPAGRHVVELAYRDSAIGEGLVVSAVAWALLLGAWAVAVRHRRRRDMGGRA